jgi:hypothetical protein
LGMHLCKIFNIEKKYKNYKNKKANIKINFFYYFYIFFSNLKILHWCTFQ